MSTIHEKLAQIQRELKAPKGRENKFGGFDYRSCEDILNAVKPLLDGLALTLSDDISMIGERFYVKATATLSNGTDFVVTTAYARESLDKKGMDSAQVTGAASSYARKYALSGLFSIDNEKDPDTEEGEGKGGGTSKRQSARGTTPPVNHGSNNAPTGLATRPQIQRIQILIKELGVEDRDEKIGRVNNWLAKGNKAPVSSTSELQQKDAADLIRALEKQVDAKRFEEQSRDPFGMGEGDYPPCSIR